MKKWILGFPAVALTAAAVLFVLIYNGVIHLNHPEGEIRGVDVSHYQGDIDWQALSVEDIDFAFIKATEGSSHIDPRFSENRKNALETRLRVGAYHFFSYDSPGIAQAENFIAHVPFHEGMLPPVIDVEFYGGNEKDPPPAGEVVPQLRAMADALKDHYGISPILYATDKSYRLYIAGGFDDCDVWIRSVYTAPSLSDGRDWTFWQYSNRHVLDGYRGEERYIDMNVFRGSPEEFAAYGLKTE